MKSLILCANRDGRPVSPPSKVICRECQEQITRNLEDMIANLRAKEVKL